jgi:hypothetical protein
MAAVETLSSVAGVASVMVATVVDGRRAVPVATVVLAAGLSPELLLAGGVPAVFVLLGAAAAALVVHWLAGIAGRRLPWVAGLDPTIPTFAPPQQLFGRRSVRLAAAVLAIPMASWVSFYMPVGEVAAVQGLLFPAAYAWCCGALRLVVARTVVDLAVALSMIAIASAAAWVLRSGPDALTGARVITSLVPLCALAAGWLGGRHARRAAAVSRAA